MELTFRAQQSLQNFDRRYWQHTRGAHSIRHSYLHLMAAVTEALPRNPAATLAEVAPDWPRQHRAMFAGILLEHAFRLSDQAGTSLPRVVLAAENRESTKSNFSEWLYECWRLPRIPPRRTPHELFLDFVAGLAPFARAMERLDHIPGQLPSLRDTISHLARFAVIFGPLGTRETTADELLNHELLPLHETLFLEPLYIRLEQLKRRFAKPALTR